MERVYANAGDASYASNSPRKVAKETQQQTSGSGLASPPPSPSLPASPASPRTNQRLDFPSLDLPYDPTSPSEALVSHPIVITSINRLVAAAGQMAAMTQTPFLSLCDASMGVSVLYMLMTLCMETDSRLSTSFRRAFAFSRRPILSNCCVRRDQRVYTSAQSPSRLA